MTHPSLSIRQREVLRARCQSGSRKAAGQLFRPVLTAWSVGQILRTILCCTDDAQACFEHRVELEAMRAG